MNRDLFNALSTSLKSANAFDETDQMDDVLSYLNYWSLLQNTLDVTLASGQDARGMGDRSAFAQDAGGKILGAMDYMEALLAISRVQDVLSQNLPATFASVRLGLPDSAYDEAKESRHAAKRLIAAERVIKALERDRLNSLGAVVMWQGFLMSEIVDRVLVRQHGEEGMKTCEDRVGNGSIALIDVLKKANSPIEALLHLMILRRQHIGNLN